MFCHGHGIFVGGIIGARDNVLDIVGIEPASILVSVKVPAAAELAGALHDPSLDGGNSASIVLR